MEKSSQPSFLKSLALAFGDGLLFGVAMRLAQGPPKVREDGMTDLSPLAERLRTMEDQTQTIDRNGLSKLSEGLDGRVLEKVVVALEARLTEHVGIVERRLAEMDAQLALDLKAVDSHTAAQTSAFEKALQQMDAQVREYLAAAQTSTAGQIAEVDQKIIALEEALPVKFREIVDAVRQSMEARVALELKQLEERVASRGIAPERLEELRSNLRVEVDAQIDALSGRLDTELRELMQRQQSQAAPIEHALHQLETKLSTLREELPPKIRQIVEAVEASMDVRISAGDEQASSRIAGLEQALASLRADLPSAGSLQQTIDESLKQHAEQVGALDQKLSRLQEELPPKIKAIVDAVRESLDARMAVELETIAERQRTNPELAQLRNDLGVLDARLAGMSSEMEGLRRSPEIEKALAYASLLEARVEALERKLQQSTEETIERAAERVWQAIEKRLQERQPPAETVTGLRQKSASAEQDVLDLIADIGQLFEKPAPRAVPPVPEPPAPEPAASEPAPPVATVAEPEPELVGKPVGGGQIQPAPDDMPPVMLFRPKDSGRKWRIPFVSSFLLLTAAAIIWLVA